MSRIPISEMKSILKMYAQHFTQKEIKLAVDGARMAAGTFEGKGISTNTISQLSPGSQHQNRRIESITEYDTKDSVLQVIKRCLKCTMTHARKVYNRNIKPVCLSRFTDPNNANMMSIRYYAEACNSRLYYLMTSVDYGEFIGYEEDEYDGSDDIWTMKSAHDAIDVYNGSLSYEDIMDEINSQIVGEGGDWEPQLINVCIIKS